MVTISIRKTDFENDVFTYQYSGNKTVKLVKVVEGFVERFRPISINGIIMQIEEYNTLTKETAVIPCPTIIGMANEYVAVMTDDFTILGKELTIDNIEQCYLELT